MEAVSLSETLVSIYKSTYTQNQRYIVWVSEKALLNIF
jgi:hypothetical protein